LILVKLMGGHSNQLFQYAIGRRLAIKHNTELKLDLTWFDGPFSEGTTKRYYELDAYPIVAKVANRADLARVNVPPHTWKRRAYQKVAGSLQLFKEPELGDFYPEAARAPDNSYLVGFWQNEVYFKDIRRILLDEFEPIKPLSAKNNSYLRQIQNCESVSLHVRREDYVTSRVHNQFHGLMDVKYYKTAISELGKRLEGKPFKIFVFSKEIDWCKKNLNFGQPLVFVEGNANGADDMRLMKHCKHNILANSSFSWWGAWLNPNPDKIVIAPKKWFNSKDMNIKDRLPQPWIKL